MFTVAVSMMLLFAAWAFRNYWWRMIKTKRYGMETEASVSRVENRIVAGYGGGIYGRSFPVFDCYVSFRTEDGRQVEFRLLNPKKYLEPGSPIRIKDTGLCGYDRNDQKRISGAVTRGRFFAYGSGKTAEVFYNFAGNDQAGNGRNKSS